MALFHTTVLDNQIKALDTIGTATGSIATFDTDRAERLVNLEVAITATQSGSGTPSPSNPRTINGFSACNLSVNGTTETIPFGQTVYGGRLNVGSGVLTVTHGYVDLGSLSWSYDSGNARFYTTDIATLAKLPTGYFEKMNGKCEIFNIVEAVNWNTDLSISLFPSGSLFVVDHNYTDATAFTSAVNGHLLTYELATPTEIQLDSKQIQAIIGTNNIYADTGDIIDLKFVLTVGQAIS